MTLSKIQDKRGIALTVVVVVMIVMAILSTYAMNLGYNQKLLTDQSSGRRAKIYYRAQAGLVHAYWRIRVNNTAGLAPAGSFATDAYNPGPYTLDVDGDGVNDVSVDIGPVTDPATKQRAILATGLDV